MIAARQRIWLAAGLLLPPTATSAHIIAPQYSVFDNGALHSVANLQLLVPLVVLGIALGRGTKLAASLAGLLGLAAFAGGALLWNRPGNPLAGFGVPLSFVASGIGLIAGNRLAPVPALLAAVAVGAVTGGLGRQEDLVQGWPGWFTLGLAVGAALVVFFGAAGARRFQPGWTQIPVRILASWMLAIGFMLFGLALRPPAPPAGGAAATTDLTDIAPCPGPHSHAPDGEIVCLPVPKIDKAGTPSAIVRYGNAPPDLTEPGPPKHRAGAEP